MSFKDDPTDGYWKENSQRLIKLKRQYRVAPSQDKQKYSQRFCEKWLQLFNPWLARCEDDPNKPFCKACQCRLDCNRCHLQRHERTTKHGRNLEILINRGEYAARQNLSIRQERSKYYQQRKMNSSAEFKNENSEISADEEDDYMDDDDLEQTLKLEINDDNDIVVNNASQEVQFAPTETAPCDQFNEEIVAKQEVLSTDDNFDLNIIKHSTPKISEIVSNGPDIPIRSVAPPGENKVKQDVKNYRTKLYLQIQKNKKDLLDSYQALVACNASLSQSPLKEKNHVDLFFDSASSSVKALSPKLIAEAKMRVSQLICELELRALTEQDPTAQCGSATTSVVMTTEGNSTTPAATYIINEANNIMLHDQTIGGTHHYGGLS